MSPRRAALSLTRRAGDLATIPRPDGQTSQTRGATMNAQTKEVRRDLIHQTSYLLVAKMAIAHGWPEVYRRASDALRGRE